jgi:putative hydrolase of the HAD superfamily
MALNPEPIRRIIFDLDDTLFDTNGQLVDVASIESFRAMIAAGLNANLNDCLVKRREFIANDPRKDVYVQLKDHFGVKPDKDPLKVVEAGFTAFHNREIKEKIFLFDNVKPMLEELQEIYDLYLVTMGSPHTQKKKVELLELEPLFSEILYVNVTTDKNKTKAFQHILDSEPKLSPECHLAVGNRIDSEIRDAKSLGMQTVLLLHGEYVNLKPQTPNEEPDERIKSITEILDLL